MPSAAEKLASQLGELWVAQVMPMLGSGGWTNGIGAHQAGLYSGLTYTSATGGGFTAKFRRSLSEFGTGVGRRQGHLG